MITERLLEDNDRLLLENSLSKDEFHKDTPADFFYNNRALCKIYEDENGPIMFVRGSKALRIDVQFVDNMDSSRNISAMLDRINILSIQAKEAGFNEIVFYSNYRPLVVFCKRKLGFSEVDGELRKLL